MRKSRRARKRKPPEPEPAPQPPSRRAVLAAASLVFVLLLALYRATVIPTVVDQDSGELVAAVHVLGIAHPTGYPLWVLLGRVFDYLPLGGTSAYRVAMLSGVCAAAAGGIITALAAGLAGELAPAALAGLAFGLWFPTWSQAVRAEVYGLSGLLFALALAAFVRWGRVPSARRLYWVALGCGAVGMHHRTAMLAALPALAVALILTRPRRVRSYAAAGLTLIAPLALYAYLPIRAAARPPVNWTDPVTWGRFWEHLLATQYQGFALSHTVEQMAQEAVKLLPALLAPEVGWSVLLAAAGLPLIAWGGAWWARREPWIAGSLAAGACLLVFWVLQWGETTDLKVFLLPLGAVLALYGAVGMARLGERLSPGAARWGALAAVAVVMCGALLRTNWERSDLSNLWQHRDRWVAMLEPLEPNAVFISDNDVPSFATMYLQTVEGLRPDVTLIRVVPLPTNWYIDTLKDRALRESVRQAWAETESALADLARTEPGRYQWERTAVFAYLLAKRLGGRRAVYVLHGPVALTLPRPPYFFSLSEDLVRVQFDRPSPVSRPTTGPARVQFPNGAALAGFTLAREDAAAGEMLGFTALWRLAQPLPPSQFGVALLPPGETPSDWDERDLEDMRLVSGFFFLNGQWETPPSSPDTAYEQRGELIVPSNAATATAEYSVWVGVGLPYAQPIRTEGDSRSPLYLDWTEIGRLHVDARPLPRNGP